MTELRYVIPLSPITKKNSMRIVQNRKTKRPYLLPSRQYKEYEAAAALHLTPRPPRPIECELNVKCLFYMPTRRKTDLTNLLEAVDDILVHAGIIADDNYTIIASHDGSRVLYDKHRPRTEITITRMPGDWQLSIPM